MKTKSAYASLDIGSSSITASISLLKEPGKLEVISLAREPLRAMNQGVITNLETVSETISRVLAKAEMIAGFSAPALTVSVTSAQSQSFQSHGIAAVAGIGTHGGREVTLSDIERVVEMANSVSVPADRVILHSIPYRFLVDHTEVEEPHRASGVRLESEVYLVTQSKSILESLHRAVLQAGYRIEEVILQSIASAEGVVGEDEKKMGALLIDIGGQNTDYVLVKNGGVMLTGMLPIGADHITKDLVYGLKTTFQHAEDIKLKYGHILEHHQADEAFITVPLASQNRTTRIPQRVVAQIIEPRISEILSLIKTQLSENVKEQETYSSIILTGGGALTRDIVEITEDIFHLPARIGHPLASSSIQEDIHSPLYATLIGLQRLSLEKWERTQKSLPASGDQRKHQDPHALQTQGAGGSDRPIKKISHYFKGLFH